MQTMVPIEVLALAEQGSAHGQLPGAALIVDVEGSTALSARLQPHGVAGAESLADLLSAVFTPMVEMVTANSGFIAEFAGDGIVALFLGDPEDAVARAVAAALAIMSTLEEITELDTPDGPVRLTARAVVGAGSVKWFIWSIDEDAPQQAAFTYRGGAVMEARRGEQLTPGRTLALGPEAQRHLPADTATQTLSEGFASLKADTDWTHLTSPHEPPLFDGDGSTVAFYPPSITEATHRGEFRDVVSVFVDFHTLPDTSPNSDMATMLELIAAHRGYLCNVTSPDPDLPGVRALALWGAPTSREHDVGYAMRFLDDLRAATASGGVRAGATLSTVYAGFVGTHQHASYTGIGFGVNLAARMCASAEWGEVLVDERIRSHLEPPWELDDLGQRRYRGFDHATGTHSLKYVPPVRQPDAFRGAFVGRAQELDQLEDALAPLWFGRSCGVIAVAGEAGIGKSRLVDELKARLASREPAPVWLEARADEIRSQPFATLRDALAGYFGRPGTSETDSRLATYMQRLEGDAPELSAALARSRRSLADLLGDRDATITIEPKVQFQTLVTAVENLVRAVENTGPAILYVADAQWIDDGTAEILRTVAEDLAEHRVAIVLETRDPEAGLAADRRIDVGPLEQSEIRELAEEFLDAPPPDELVTLLVDRSNGNTFFVRQLLEFLDRSSLLGADVDGADAATGEEIPTDLRRLLVSQLDALPVGERRIVQIASVLGRDVDVPVLETMVEDQTTIEPTRAAMVSASMWESIDEDHVAFTNLLTRDAAYGMLLRADVEELHGAAARGIETVRGSNEDTAALLAFHYEKARHLQVAAGHYLAAGRAAADRYSNAEALSHLEQAAHLLDETDIARRFAVLDMTYQIRDVLGDRAAQSDVLDAMDALGATDPDTKIRIMILRARLDMAVGSYGAADSVVDAALGREVVSVSDRGALNFLKAQLSRHQGNIDAARIHAQRARSLFDEADAPIRVASVDDFLGGIAWETGDFASAAQSHQTAAEAFHAQGNATDEIRALNNLGSALFSLGDYSAARTIHEDGAHRSFEIGYQMGEGDHLDNVGGTAWAVGDYPLAISQYSAALEIRERMDDAWGIAISKSNLGGAYRAQGDPAQGLEQYRQALDIDREIGRRRGEAYDLHGIGLCQLDMGHYNLASEALGQAATIREELGEEHLANESHVACAVGMLRRGDAAPANSLVNRMLDREHDSMFDGAVETTATLLRCVEVIAQTEPDRATALRAFTSGRVAERAERISDPGQRESYLRSVAAHRDSQF